MLMDRCSELYKSDEFLFLIMYVAIGTLYLAGKLNEGLYIGFYEF